jgi:hypothetical protein
VIFYRSTPDRDPEPPVREIWNMFKHVALLMHPVLCAPTIQEG